jgi:hypothetical protein
MKTFQTSSLAHLKLLQKACESLVVINTVSVQHIYNATDRTALLTETQQANDMVDHLRNLISENEREG